MAGRKTRVAVVFESDIFDRKGQLNAIHGRIGALVRTGRYEIVPFCLQCRETALSRRIKHLPKRPHVRETEIDGVRYRILWYRFSLLDWFLTEKLHRHPVFFRGFVRKAAGRLGNFEIISAHSFEGGLVAQEASSRFGIPFFITWHGSDIHTRPWKNILIRKETERLTAAADGNFYVSAALMETSSPFPGRKWLLRNGIGPEFRVLPEEEKKKLRLRYGLSEGTKVVAYAGHFFHVKNTLSLPGIWQELRSRHDGPLVFWVIGDGKEFPQVRDRIVSLGLNAVFLGNRPPEEMPELMNCIDVLMLPSFNEGMPLVTMEALSCGCNVVGSRAGGIPEVIGEEFTVPLGKDFGTGMAGLAEKCLAAPPDQLKGRGFGWGKTAEEEDRVYRGILEEEPAAAAGPPPRIPGRRRRALLRRLALALPLPDKTFLRMMFKAKTGEKLHLRTPLTFNEKMQWLKLNLRKDEMTVMVDKYAAKAWIAQRVGDGCVNPNLGVWDTADGIDFDSLPDKFVLKTTHDCGGVVICRDRASFNKEEAKATLTAALSRRFWKENREWPYKGVTPRIIAEPYLEDKFGELRDYKFFCFDGEPRIMFVATGRSSSEETCFDFFDMDYRHLDIRNGHPNAAVPPQKPDGFDKMKELASKLSAGWPFLRVDFYEAGGRVYVGELTFYHWSGFVPFDPRRWDRKLGSWIKLPV
ncbi:MAG: glycosyltransferase [Bacteroidales bacterium]|nr:glycosyltransferase [Bacteroidales bacterium]